VKAQTALVTAAFINRNGEEQSYEREISAMAKTQWRGGGSAAGSAVNGGTSAAATAAARKILGARRNSGAWTLSMQLAEMKRKYGENKLKTAKAVCCQLSARRRENQRSVA